MFSSGLHTSHFLPLGSEILCRRTNSLSMGGMTLLKNSDQEQTLSLRPELSIGSALNIGDSAERDESARFSESRRRFPLEVTMTCDWDEIHDRDPLGNFSTHSLELDRSKNACFVDQNRSNRVPPKRTGSVDIHRRTPHDSPKAMSLFGGKTSSHLIAYLPSSLPDQRHFLNNSVQLVSQTDGHFPDARTSDHLFWGSVSGDLRLTCESPPSSYSPESREWESQINQRITVDHEYGPAGYEDAGAGVKEQELSNRWSRQPETEPRFTESRLGGMASHLYAGERIRTPNLVSKRQEQAGDEVWRPY